MKAYPNEIAQEVGNLATPSGDSARPSVLGSLKTEKPRRRPKRLRVSLNHLPPLKMAAVDRLCSPTVFRLRSQKVVVVHDVAPKFNLHSHIRNPGHFLLPAKGRTFAARNGYSRFFKHLFVKT